MHILRYLLVEFVVCCNLFKEQNKSSKLLTSDMKCFSLHTTRFRRRICLILFLVVILTFINLLLCTWKDISWEDEEFEFNIVELTHLGKRRTYKHTPKATQEILNRPSLQRWANQKTPRPTTPRAIPHGTAWARMGKSSSPVYHTRLRKQDRTPPIKEDEQFTLKTQTVPAQKEVDGKVKKFILNASLNPTK